MNLTMSAGVAEIKRKSSASIGEAAGILSKGLLMGARGILALFYRSCSVGSVVQLLLMRN